VYIVVEIDCNWDELVKGGSVSIWAVTGKRSTV
jgi:hypothetical protein